jgi:hypothetical protein
MKATIKVEKEVTLSVLEVNAGVRCWESASVNDVEDSEEGELIPCKDGERWKPIIDIESGVITNWTKGVTASVCYKVCDDGIYTVKDDTGVVVLELDDYVPRILCPVEDGYGDYIHMNIDADGLIEGWSKKLVLEILNH